MILHCNYEELKALAAAAEAMLAGVGMGAETDWTETRGDVENVERLLPRLTGDLSIETIGQQREVRSAVGLLCRTLHSRMDEIIIEYHPAHEEAVALYFDYAHARTVLHRLDEMGAEMRSILDVMTDGRPEMAVGMTFPD